MALEKTLRWFGQNDPVSLSEIRQTGVEGIVTALHHIPKGQVWPLCDIRNRKSEIEQAGMSWHVVESLPISDAIKTGSAEQAQDIENYKESMRNLARCGVDTICYNFMPVLDWARTNLKYTTETGGESMLFDYPTFAAFDVFILERPNAEKDYPGEIVKLARSAYGAMTEQEAELLAFNIIVVTQGFIHGAIDSNVDDYKSKFLEYINSYKHIDQNHLRENLGYFLDEVIPVAEELNMNMAIHGDDPSFPLLGLPRIVSNIEDLKWIFNRQTSVRNGLTFCSGSFSTNRNNDLIKMVNQFADRIHFAHIRNTQFLENKSFYESGHLKGSIDVYALVKALLKEQNRRIHCGRKDNRIPIRPDDGIKILNDFKQEANPGYPLIGRLRGLAEIEGLEEGIRRDPGSMDKST